MYITKSFTAENGSEVTHHAVAEVLLVGASDTFRVLVRSWANEASKLSGYGAIDQSFHIVPVSALNYAVGFKQAMLNYLLNEQRFIGGVAYPEDDANSLETAKVLRRNVILAERARREYATFTFNGQEYDADAESQRRIIGAVLAYVLASLNQQPFQIDWTLANDDVVTLEGNSVAGMGVALMTHVDGLYNIARELRAAIDAATTVEEVSAVVWPG